MSASTWAFNTLCILQLLWSSDIAHAFLYALYNYCLSSFWHLPGVSAVGLNGSSMNFFFPLKSVGTDVNLRELRMQIKSAHMWCSAYLIPKRMLNWFWGMCGSSNALSGQKEFRSGQASSLCGELRQQWYLWQGMMTRGERVWGWVLK